MYRIKEILDFIAYWESLHELITSIGLESQQVTKFLCIGVATTNDTIAIHTCLSIIEVH